MLPLFKSHYSIGKSILTLNHPDKFEEGGSDSVFKIAQDHDLEQVILVEDSLTGFLEAKKVSDELEKQLIFGLRISIKNGSEHKVIVFAKNSKGVKLLNKIYSTKNSSKEKNFSINDLADNWDEESLALVIPFYDSLIFNNLMTFAGCIPEFEFTSPTFFLEDSNLPFDKIIKDKVVEYCKKNKLKTETSKTILYKDYKDFDAWLTYKIATNRKFGRNQSLYCPNFDHLGSNEFCFESFLKSA